MGQAHAWRPDAHFNSLACHPVGDAHRPASEWLADAIAVLEGAAAAIVVASVRAQGARERFASLEPQPIATLSVDTAGQVQAEALNVRCPELAEQAHEHGGLAYVDNSLAGPWMARPLERGADVVIERLEAWLGIDAVALAARTSAVLASACTALGLEVRLSSEREQNRNSADGLSEFELVCGEGLRMLPLVGARCQRRSDTALAVASYLGVHPRIERISYPGLAEDPANEAARRALDHGFGPLLTFEARGIPSEALLARAREQRCLEVAGDNVVGITEAATAACCSCDRSRLSRIGDSVFALEVGLEDPLDVVEALEATLL